MIVLIFGPSRSGKTALAQEIVRRSDAIYISDEDAKSITNYDAQSVEELARITGAIARLISRQGKSVVVDLECSTAKIREAFGKSDYRVWMDRAKGVQEEHWQEPRSEDYDIKINSGITVEQECDFFFEKLMARK
jgi:adenylate kinase family enzyme